MTKLGYTVAFVLGGAVAAVVTWALTKKRYSDLAQEEIDSVKETFERHEKSRMDIPKENTIIDPKEIDTEVKNDEIKPKIHEYASKLKDEGYTNYNDISNQKIEIKEPENKKKDRPYVITPEEFGEIPDYEKISLTYYIDGTLADDDDDIIYDIDQVIGNESLNHFGEYEDDSVFVRNDRKKCDYEILLDQREYRKVMETKPYKRRDSEI
jgi:hypothetical protein